MLSRASAVGVVWVSFVGGVWAAGGGVVNSPGELGEEVISPGAAAGALSEGLVELGRASTVFALNFSNLFIVLGIKLIALFLLGGLGFGFVGRSTDGEETPWLDGGDVLFTLAYLVGDATERYDCLNQLGCLDTHKGQEVLMAASVMAKGARFLNPIFGSFLTKYEQVSWDLEDAVLYGREGGPCRSRYTCSAMPSL